MTEATDYRAIFTSIESTLIRVGNQSGRKDDIRHRLDYFKTVSGKTRTDADYFRLMVHIAFYSGFKAVVVSAKLPVIDNFFADYQQVADYGPREVGRMLADPGMIHHKGKIQGCIENARAVRAVVAEYGSFREYVESFSPRSSLDNLMRLRKDLKTRFAYLGSITSYHFLTDIGMPVLKPDRVIRRIFSRLGVVEDASETERRLSDVVRKGNEFAQATGHPIRYIDIVFVAYGQVKGEVGLAQGICLEKQPRCSICGATGYCQYFLSPTAGKA